MTSPRLTRFILLALGLCSLAVVILLARGGDDQPDRAAVEEMLRARSAALRNQMDLARDGQRFLVLDPERGTLTLYHGAAPLRSFTVLEVQAGQRRVGVGRGNARDDWRTARWEGSRLEPPVVRDRRVIVSDSVEPPDPTGEVDWVPPVPEEAVPTPPRFVIHFDAGLGMEVVAAGADSSSAPVSLSARAEHRLRRFLPRNWDRYRIRTVIPAAEAGALYRSLPDSVALVAIIPR